jgi:hypothetical protein
VDEVAVWSHSNKFQLHPDTDVIKTVDSSRLLNWYYNSKRLKMEYTYQYTIIKRASKRLSLFYLTTEAHIATHVNFSMLQA